MRWADAREIERQAERLEVLTEWQKAGIDVESLYIPSKVPTDHPKTNSDPT